MKNLTESINRMRADAFVSLEPRDLRRAYVVFFNKYILSNAFALHRFPQIVV